MTHEAPAAGTDEYRHLAQADVDYLNSLTWSAGECGFHGRECSPQVTAMHIEQGTLPGGQVQICRRCAGVKLHLARLGAQNRCELGYEPNIHAA